MSELPRIESEESLEAWLRTRPPEDATLIAHRAAMRVVPRWFNVMRMTSWTHARELTPIPVLRATLASGVAGKYSDPDTLGVARTAARAAATAAVTYKDAVADSDAFDYHDAFNHNDAIIAARAAAATTSVSAVAFSLAFSIAFNDASVVGILESVQADVHGLTRDEDPSQWPLWAGENPFASIWQQAQPILRATPGGEFWIDWYQRALDGRPQNWPLLRDVVLINDELWEQGGEALDARINELRQQHALAATANGERIEPNPDSGKLRLVPATQLPDDIAAYARRKIIKAVEIFDGQTGQAYGGLTADLTMLRRAVEDAGNLPVELFDACAAATRRLAVRVRSGDCPSDDQDPLIADYRNRLREVGADILASDTETAKILERRAAISGNDALIEAREVILEAVDAAGPALEGRLADALPQDADTATDPASAPEDRAAASFRLAGRLLRISKEIGKGFMVGNAAMVGSAGYFQAVEFFAKSREVSQTLKAIFRYIGL